MSQSEERRVSRRDVIRLGAAAAISGVIFGAAGFLIGTSQVRERVITITRTVEREVARPEEEVRFGAVLPLTGILTDPGRSMLRGLLMGVDYVNEVEGGIFVEEFGKKVPVRLLVYDDRSDPTRAKSLAERLILVDNVSLIFSSFSFITFAASVVSEERGVPMIPLASWSDKIYDRGFKYVFNPFWRTSEEARMVYNVIEEVNRRLGRPIRRVAIVHADDAYSGTVGGQLAEKYEEDPNYELLTEEQIPARSLDYSSVVLKIKPLNPDLLIHYHLASADAIVNIIRQMADQDVNPKMFYTAAAAEAPTVLPTLGTLMEGVIAHTHDLVGVMGDKFIPELYKWYTEQKVKRKLPEWPRDTSEISGLDAFMVAVLGVERAGSTDPKRIRDSLATNEFMSFAGPVKFDETGVNTRRIGSMGLVQVQGNKFRFLAPSEFMGIKIPAADVLYPKPRWKV